MALQKQEIPIPLIGALDDKTDLKQQRPDTLYRVFNGVYKKEGKVNKRNGYDFLSNKVIDGDDISQGLALSQFNNQLQMFDGSRLYSYLDGVNKWTDRGTIYSASISSRNILAGDYVQSNVSCDSNEGITVYAWDDSRGGVRCSVLDESKGALILSDFEVSSSGSNPVVFRMNRYLLIIYAESNNIRYRRVNVTQPSQLSTSVTLVDNLDTTTDMYDVVRIRERLFIAWHSTQGTSSIGIRHLNASLILSSAVYMSSTDPETVLSIIPDFENSRAWLYYTDDGALYQAIYDYDLNEVLEPTDVYPNGAIVTKTTNFFRRLTGIVESSESRIFIDYENIGVTSQDMFEVTVDVNGARQTLDDEYLSQVRTYSRIFKYKGNNFFILLNDSDIQPTYFVYNINKSLLTKILPGNSGDYLEDHINPRNIPEISSSVFKLPLQKKGRLLSNEDDFVFSSLGVYGITLDFEADTSFTSSELASTLHIAGGTLQMFDGNSLVEHGFNVFPELPAVTSSGSGDMAAGTYQFTAVFKWVDNQGLIHRSAPSIPQSVTVSADGRVAITRPQLSQTNKDNVKVEIYRTLVNGTIFYKLYEIDNDDAGGTAFNGADDNDIRTNEILYTTGGVLENVAAPACTIMTSHKNRLFISGLENPYQIQYSKLAFEGFPVEFNDTLVITLDSFGGKVTAMKSMDDKLIIFKEQAIYALSGDGPNNLGLEDDYGEPVLISSDVGCSDPNSVVLTPNGLMFKSSKGIYEISRSLQVGYIGAPVEDFNNLTISSATMLEDENEIRFTTSDQHALIYNYFFKKWSVFTNFDAVDSLVYSGKFAHLDRFGRAKVQNDIFTDNGSYIKLKLITPWFSLAGVQGYKRVYKAGLLGEYKSPHSLMVKTAFDFNPAFTEEVLIDAEARVSGGLYGQSSPYGSDDTYGGKYRPYQFFVYMANQKCQSVRFSIEDVQFDNFGEGFDLSNINLTVGAKGRSEIGSDASGAASTKT